MAAPAIQFDLHGGGEPQSSMKRFRLLVDLPPVLCL
jgi:hypothetical protein